MSNQSSLWNELGGKYARTMGQMVYAKTEPIVVPSAPTKKHQSTRPVQVMTLLKSAVSSSSGTASGNRNAMTTSYAGAWFGMTPGFGKEKGQSCMGKQGGGIRESPKAVHTRVR